MCLILMLHYWNCLNRYHEVTLLAWGYKKASVDRKRGEVKANKDSFFTLPPDPITPFLGLGDERLVCNWRGGNKWK